MSADSYLEYFLILLGWILNNAIWKTLLSTGLFALPIAGKVVATRLRTREEGTMRAIRARWRWCASSTLFTWPSLC